MWTVNDNPRSFREDWMLSIFEDVQSFSTEIREV